MDDECVLVMESGDPEFVWCGEEFLVRIPVMIAGKEVGEVIVASEDDAL